MQSIRTISPLLRAVAVISAVAVLAVSVTFAALTSNSVVLADSQFDIATPGLEIAPDADGSVGGGPGAYTTTSVAGFSFSNVVPGTETAAFPFWLKNTGEVDLNISGVSTLGTVSGTIADGSKIHFKIKNETTASGTVDFTYTQLTDGTPDAMPGNPLSPSEENQYSVKLLVDDGAFSGAMPWGISDLDWTFTGTQP